MINEKPIDFIKRRFVTADNIIYFNEQFEGYLTTLLEKLPQANVSGRSKQFYCWDVAVGEQRCNKQCKACKNDDRK